MIIHSMFIWETLMQNKVTTLNYLKMERLIVLLVMICGMMPLLWASDGLSLIHISSLF